MTTHTPTTEEIGNKMADICNQWEALYDKAAAERNELREQRDELLAALKELSAMYTHTWDSVNGDLLMLVDSIPRFEAAHEKARAALARCKP